jgi:hypothetical protein
MRVKSSERVPRQALQAQNDADVLYTASPKEASQSTVSRVDFFSVHSIG